MRTLTYPRDVRAMPLLEELQAAGLPVMAVHPDHPAGTVAIDLDVAPDDTSQDAATDAVVAAHDPTALDAKADAARHTYDQAVGFLKNYRTLPSPTQTQTVNAVKALIDVTKKLNADLREQGEAAAGGTP